MANAPVFLLATFLAVIFRRCSGHGEIAIAANCTDLGDGTYADPSFCEMFYQCRGGTIYTFSCPRTTVFNPDSNTCDSSDNYVCEFRCPLEDGVYADPKHCETFFFCRDRDAIEMTCPPAFPVFNPEVRTCDTKDSYPCGNVVVLPTTTTVPPATTTAMAAATTLLTGCHAVGVKYLASKDPTIAASYPKSATECHSTCQQNMWCESWTFDIPEKTCTQWMQDEVTGKSPNADTISGPKNCPGACYTYGMSYSGSGPLKTGIPSSFQCQRECEKSSTCVVWSYQAQGGSAQKCWLYRSMGQLSPSMYKMSGPKHCPGDCTINFGFEMLPVMPTTMSNANMEATLSACQNLCQSNDNCKNWAYDKKLEKCVMYKGMGFSKLDIVFGPQRCSDDYCFAGKESRANGGYVNSFRVVSVEMCQILCQEEPTCGFFEFYVMDHFGTCNLFKSGEATTYGPENCPA